MMMIDLLTTAIARLQHAWELQGSGDDPTPAIRRIADEVANPRMRHDIEAHLYDEWARLCAREGDEL